MKIISCAQLDIRDRAHKPPKPRRGDRVELLDMSKMFGRVVAISSAYTVEVKWESDGFTTFEFIKDLALVERKI